MSKKHEHRKAAPPADDNDGDAERESRVERAYLLYARGRGVFQLRISPERRRNPKER